MFSKPRLEGRALEHAIAGQSGNYCRMLTDAGEVVLVRSEEAKAARQYMRTRYREVESELAGRGFACQGGDKAAVLAVRDKDALSLPKREISVDLCGWSKQMSRYALVEVKWTRLSLQKSVEKARSSIPKLKAACLRGTWASRNPISAGCVGILVVTPTRWRLELQEASGPARALFASSDEPPPMPQPSRKRKSGVSNWVKWRGDAAPGEVLKWPSGKSGSARKRY